MDLGRQLKVADHMAHVRNTVLRARLMGRDVVINGKAYGTETDAVERNVLDIENAYMLAWAQYDAEPPTLVLT